MKKRYVSVFLPQWSIEIAHKIHGVTPHELVLTKERCLKKYIVRCCERSRALGIKEGMPLELAETLAPDLAEYSFNGQEEFALLSSFVEWAYKFSPLVGLDPQLIDSYKRGECPCHLATGIFLDISGTERLHQGEKKLAHTILRKCAEAGITARIGISPTLTGAWACARYGRDLCTIIPSRQALITALAPFPPQALRLSHEVCTALASIGIESVKMLLSLPRKEVGQRWGMTTLNAVMSALGEREERFKTIRPALRWQVKHLFESPLTRHEAVTNAASHLFTQLTNRLDKKHKRAKRFHFIFGGRSLDGTPFTLSREIFLVTGTSNRSHLSLLLEPVLSNCHFQGGIHTISILALETEDAHSQQENFSGETEYVIRYTSLINQLVAKLGSQQVCALSLYDSYIPERSYAFTPITLNTNSLSHLPFSLRPSSLFNPPERVDVLAMLPDSPPSALTWRGVHRKISYGWGPEDISPEWWQQEPKTKHVVRHYYRVQDERGQWLWLFRQDREWFVHGLWS